MPTRDLDCVFYIEKPPTFSFTDGMFRLCFDVGKRASFELVMSPSNFIKMRRRSGEIAAKWQVDQLDKVASIREH